MTKRRQKVNINAREASVKSVTKLSPFRWDQLRGNVAIYLAQGYTIQETADEYGVSARTIKRWKKDAEFSAEVNRLSLMVDIAGRAERLRIAMRMIRKLGYNTKQDLLDWLKFAQSETDGAKIGLAAEIDASIIAALVSMAGSGSDRDSGIQSSSAASHTIINGSIDRSMDR